MSPGCCGQSGCGFSCSHEACRTLSQGPGHLVSGVPWGEDEGPAKAAVFPCPQMLLPSASSVCRVGIRVGRGAWWRGDRPGWQVRSCSPRNDVPEAAPSRWLSEATSVCWEDGDTLGARAWRASQGEGVPTPSPVTHTETERPNLVAFPCHSSSLRQAQLRAGVINEPLAAPGRVTQAGDGAAGGAPPSARHPARAGVAALASAVETAGPRERPA